MIIKNKYDIKHTIDLYNKAIEILKSYDADNIEPHRIIAPNIETPDNVLINDCKPKNIFQGDNPPYNDSFDTEIKNENDTSRIILFQLLVAIIELIILVCLFKIGGIL